MINKSLSSYYLPFDNSNGAIVKKVVTGKLWLFLVLAIIGPRASSATTIMANAFIEHPSFITDEKSMAEYEEDVRMWSRLTSLKPENHAEAIVFVLGKQKHPI